MPEKRTEIVKIHGVVQTIPSYQQLVKTNRLLLGVVFFLMCIVIGLGLFFIPNPDVSLGNPKYNTAVATVQGTNPAVSPEVSALKGQLVGLVSGSIESKLKSLEDSIKSGADNNALGTIADLKNDVNTLRTYSEPSRKPQTVATVSNVQLAEEVTHLKHLIYMSLASCALMFVAATGVWVKYRKRLPYKEEKTGFLGRR